MWLDRLAYKLRRFAIPDLMKYIVLGMGAVFLLDLLLPAGITGLLVFSRAAVFAGQFWRLISFVFIPVSSSLLFILFSLYLYWLIGEALEREWGEAKFTLFYMTGVVGTIVAGLITGFATNFYLNMSLFLAFAILFPNFELLIFFVLPVKIKWLAYLDAAFLLYELIVSPWPVRIALLVAMLNVLLFFERGVRDQIQNYRRRQQWKKNFRNR